MSSTSTSRPSMAQHYRRARGTGAGAVGRAVRRASAVRSSHAPRAANDPRTCLRGYLAWPEVRDTNAAFAWDCVTEEEVMTQSGPRVPRVLAIDAGGTMTDTFIVDEHGSFVVGKAQTTPEDESVGFMASARDALAQWDSTPEEGFPDDRLGDLLGHRDAQPAAPAQGPEGRLHRQRRARGLPAAGARDPDAPRLLLLRPPAPGHPLPQRAARSARSG